MEGEFEMEKSVDDLLDDLLKSSLSERQRLLLKRYGDEMKDFKKRLGEGMFDETLGKFMIEQIEGKIVAAKTLPKERKQSK